jgi:hypothetical protein
MARLLVELTGILISHAVNVSTLVIKIIIPSNPTAPMSSIQRKIIWIVRVTLIFFLMEGLIGMALELLQGNTR